MSKSSSHGINPSCRTAPIKVPYARQYSKLYLLQTLSMNLNNSVYNN